MIRRESERSNPDDDTVFRKEDVTSPQTPTSPRTPLSPKSPKSPTSPRGQPSDEPPKVMKPAPLPKENAWAKRSEPVPLSPPPTGDQPASSRPSPARAEEGVSNKAGGPPSNRTEKKFVDAPPPQQNAWGKKSTEPRSPAESPRGTGQCH